MEVHCTINRIAHTCDLHNVLKSLRQNVPNGKMRAENLGQGRSLHQFPDHRFFEEIIPDDEFMLQACIGARILLLGIYES